MLKIGEFAQVGQTSVKTLRHYEAVGLLRPAHVDGVTGYRYYEAEQLSDLRRILHLKSLGFSLRQIREALAGDGERLRALLTDKRYELTRRVNDEQLRLADVQHWLDCLERGVDLSIGMTVKRVAAQAVAAIRTAVARYADAAELFAELQHYVARRPPATSSRVAVWYTCGEMGQPIDCEASLLARADLPSTRRIRVYERPSTLLASLVYRGTPASGANPYAAARSWIAAHGFRVTGAKRDLYWQGGPEQDRASDIVEIQFPVAYVGDGVAGERA
jgi:DNA-binding transcriptional MerR regulator